MSGTSSPRSGLSRRSFLKASGAAAGALGLAAAAGMTTTDGWLSPAEAHAEAEERVAYLYHRDHCGCHCSLKCTVRDGRVCLIEPNDAWEDEGYRRVCVKGLSEIQHIYSAERIQTPMRRIGERGKAEFESISWDDAYRILKENLESIWREYGHSSVLVHCSSECRPSYPFLAPILGATTQGAVGIDMGLGNGADEAYGPSVGTTDLPGENSQVGAGYNRPTNEPRDLVHSKYILLVGNNVFHSVLTHAHILFDAQEAGAKLVAIDPHYSVVAQKSDEWVPIEPGTDAALYLGLSSIIVSKGLCDKAFMKARTDFPFLVNVSTGERLTLGEPVPDGKTGAGDNVVWDIATNSAVRHSEAQDPALSGERVIGGETYRTVYDMLSDSLKNYDAEWASEITDIPVSKLEEIAVEYATSGASSIVTGYGGNDKINNADIVGHALVVLTALTGNIAKPGASSGSFADGFHGYVATLGSWPLPPDVKSASTDVPFFRMPYEKNEIRAAIIAGDSPMNRTSNYSATEQWLAGLDFLCAIDMYYTSYTDYADLILPACTCFENEEPFSSLEAYGGYVLLREKAIDPLFDSRSDYRIQMDIADLFGKRSLLPATQEEYFRTCLEKSTDKTIEGITLDSLVEHHGVQAQSCQSVIRRAYVDRFGTPSGKMELYFQKMLPYGQALPKWEPPNEVGGDEELRKRYPLQFITIKSKFRVHNQFWDSAWNNQYESSCVEMNPVDLACRNLKTGDDVRLFNDRGECVVSVAANEAVRPGCVRMYSGAWKKYVKSGCFQYLTSDHVEERHSLLIQGLMIPFNDTLVEVEKA